MDGRMDQVMESDVPFVYTSSDDVTPGVVTGYTGARPRTTSGEQQIRGRLRSGSSTLRPMLPVAYQTHYSDSGFGSTLSSGSSCSYLPPPPPYRMRGQGHRIHRSLSDSKYGSYGSAAEHAPDFLRFSRGGWTSRSPSPSMSTVSCPEYPELQERLHRLAVARESLSLQVSVLTEQVGAQTEKIKDLESMLMDKRQKLDSTEEMLQETNKLDLMAEVSNLKLKFVNLERQKVETEHRLRMSQAEIDHLTKSMQSTQRQVLQHHGAQVQQQQQQQQQQQIPVDPGELAELVQKFRQRTGEIEQLRMAVQQLLAANEEKNQQIDGLRSLVLDQQMRHPKYHQPVAEESLHHMPRSASSYEETTEFDINQQLRKLLTEENDSGGVVSSASFPEGFYYGQQTGRVGSVSGGAVSHSISMQGFPSAIQSSSSYTSSLSAISASPQQTWSSSGTPRHQQLGGGGVLGTGLVGGVGTSQRSPSSPAARQLAAELDELRRGGVNALHNPPGPSHYYTGSLPRTLPSKKAASTLTLPRKKNSLASAASAASVESDDEMARGVYRSMEQPAAKFKRDRTRSSLRNLLGKLKRANSPDKDESEFRRGTATRFYDQFGIWTWFSTDTGLLSEP